MSERRVREGEWLCSGLCTWTNRVIAASVLACFGAIGVTMVVHAALTPLPAPAARPREALSQAQAGSVVLAPSQTISATLVKGVGLTAADACKDGATRVEISDGTTVYYCYRLTNIGSSPFEPLVDGLIDGIGTDGSGGELVTWTPPSPDYVLNPGDTLQPTEANGLIRAVTVSGSDALDRAGWTLDPNTGTGVEKTASNFTAVDVTIVNTQVLLTVRYCLRNMCDDHECDGGFLCVAGLLLRHDCQQQPDLVDQSRDHNPCAQPQQCSLSRRGGAELIAERNIENHGTDGCAVGATAKCAVSDQPCHGYLAQQRRQSFDYCALGPSCGERPSSRDQRCEVIEHGSVLVQQRHLAQQRGARAIDLLLPDGNQLEFVYLSRGMNSPSLRSSIAAGFWYALPPGGKLILTNSTLPTYGVAPVLGPIKANQSINNQLVYTVSNPSYNYQVSAVANASVIVIPGTATPTDEPTPTFTPLPGPSPTPTWTPIPIPPTPTFPPTWTPVPTPSSTPTVFIISTPGGLAPTPYPPLLSAAPQAQPGAFVSPLDPFAAATATAAAVFGFPTPILDPFGATATAAAVFGFPTPILDPFAATATAAAAFAFPTPILDPFAATATAAAAFAFPTPILDPFAATATAAAAVAAFPTPILDPAGATATAAVQMGLVAPAPRTRRSGWRDGHGGHPDGCRTAGDAYGFANPGRIGASAERDYRHGHADAGAAGDTDPTSGCAAHAAAAERRIFVFYERTEQRREHARVALVFGGFGLVLCDGRRAGRPGVSGQGARSLRPDR